MAYTVTTSGTTLQKLQRKVQGNVLVGFQRKCREWKLAQRLKDFELDASAREVTCPVDITRQPSGAFIGEGGYEAIPQTAAPQELTFTWANFNFRWSYTLTSQYIDKKFRNSELIRQSKYQTMKGIEGLSRRVAWSFYGTTDGIMALTSTNATQANGTYALLDGFGQSDIDDTTYLSSMFVVDDHVALIRSAALVANSAGGLVTASSTSGIAVTWTGSVDADANDAVVLSASSGHQLITGTIAHTDYNLAPVGLLNFTKTASVHGLSFATSPLWNVAYSDTAGALLSGTKLMRGRDEIRNKGTKEPDVLIWDQGVKRKVYESTSSAVMFNDPLNMEVMGNTKTGGIEQFESQYVPPGYVFMGAKASLNKWTLVPMPDEETGDLSNFDNFNEDKMQDINAKLASFDFPYAWICRCRANLAYWSGCTRA